MPNPRSLVLCPLVAVLSAGCSVDIHGQSQTVRTEKEFNVTAEPDLTLATFDGSVRVRSWDRNQVLVEIDKQAPSREDAEGLEVNASQEGNRIRIDAPKPRRTSISLGGGGTSVSYTVRVPRRVRLNVRSGDGSITAEDLDGTIELHSGDGSINTDGVTGALELNTGDGSIKVIRAKGRLSANTGDGSVNVDGRFDDVRVHTGDGSVRVAAEDGSTIKSEWTVVTGDGSVTLRLPAKIDADIDAQSGDGRASASGDTVTTISRSKDGNELRARVGRGGPTIRIESGDGSIDVNVR